MSERRELWERGECKEADERWFGLSSVCVGKVTCAAEQSAVEGAKEKMEATRHPRAPTYFHLSVSLIAPLSERRFDAVRELLTAEAEKIRKCRPCEISPSSRARKQ